MQINNASLNFITLSPFINYDKAKVKRTSMKKPVNRRLNGHKSFNLLD